MDQREAEKIRTEYKDMFGFIEYDAEQTEWHINDRLVTIITDTNGRPLRAIWKSGKYRGKANITKPKYKRTWGIPASAQKQVRDIVLSRDNHKCVECGKTNNLNVHHIVYRCNGGSNDSENLITLCNKCHAEKHKEENVYNIMEKRTG